MHLQAFDWIMIGFIAAMMGFLIFDIAHIIQGKQQYGTQKFALYIKAHNRLRISFYALLIISLTELVVAIFTPDIKMLYSLLLTAMAVFIYGLNDRLPAGISENGVFFWGGFVSWEKIKKISINDDMITMSISKIYGSLAFDHNVEFTYDLKHKDEIFKLIRQNVDVYSTR